MSSSASVGFRRLGCICFCGLDTRPVSIAPITLHRHTPKGRPWSSTGSMRRHDSVEPLCLYIHTRNRAILSRNNILYISLPFLLQSFGSRKRALSPSTNSRGDSRSRCEASTKLTGLFHALVISPAGIRDLELGQNTSRATRRGRVRDRNSGPFFPTAYRSDSPSASQSSEKPISLTNSNLCERFDTLMG